jgi:hypothetical protein
MIDIIYLAIALIIFFACWALLVLCDRLMEG